MKLKIIVSFLISLVILTHCKKGGSFSEDEVSKENVAAKKVSLCEKKGPVAFSLEKKIQVLDIADPRIAVSPYDDRVFVYGRSLRSRTLEFLILIFTKDLEAVGEKVFLYGQGPGEAGATNILSVGKENIYLSVNTNEAWNIYDKDLNFLRLEKYRLDMGGVFELEENGRFFIDSHRMRDVNNRRMERYAYRVIYFPEMKRGHVLYKTDWFTVREEGVMTSRRPRFVIGKNTDQSFFYRNGFVYILLCDHYQLLKVSLEGHIEKNILVDFEPQYFDGENERELLKEHKVDDIDFKCHEKIPPVSCTIPLDKGFVVTRRKDYHMNCSGDIEGDYFTYDLDSMGKVTMPCFYKIGDMKAAWLINTYRYDAKKLYLLQEKDEVCYIERWGVTE